MGGSKTGSVSWSHRLNTRLCVSLTELAVSVCVHRSPFRDGGGVWVLVVMVAAGGGRYSTVDDEAHVHPSPQRSPSASSSSSATGGTLSETGDTQTPQPHHLTYCRTHHYKTPPPGGLTPFGPYPPAFQLQPAPVTTHPLETLTLRPTPRPTPPSEATGWANPLSTTPPSHLTHEPLTPTRRPDEATSQRTWTALCRPGP